MIFEKLQNVQTKNEFLDLSNKMDKFVTISMFRDRFSDIDELVKKERVDIIEEQIKYLNNDYQAFITKDEFLKRIS